MSFMGLDPVADGNQLDYATRNPGYMADEPIATWHSLAAPFLGVQQGVQQLGLAAGEAATPWLRSNGVEIDKALGTNIAGYLDDQLQQTREAAANGARINPYVYGKAGDVMAGLTNFLTRAAVGRGVGGTLGTVAGLAASGPTEYQEQRRQDVDPQTASEMALLRSASDVVGGFLPMQAGTVGRSLATGAASMLGAGAIQRGAASSILDDAGYHDMAAQYKAFDASAMATDLVLGLAFGGAAHGVHAISDRLQGRIPALTDTALADATARHVEGSGPGIPTDTYTQNANVDAMTKATEDLLAGRPVDVSDQINPAQAKFVEDPARDELVRTQQDVINEEFGKGALQRARDFEPESVETGPPAGAEGDRATETATGSIETRGEAPARSDYLNDVIKEAPDRELIGASGESTTAAEEAANATAQAQQHEELAKAVQVAADCAGGLA